MSQIIEKFVRKLNNTELNSQSTNDAYIRLSTEIQEALPSDFLNNLNSKESTVEIKKGNKKEPFPSNKWLRYQHYPSNDEYRIVSIAEILNRYEATAGDFIILEKITIDGDFHYEVSMKVYDKISMKFSKGKDAFEILNWHQVIDKEFLEKDISLLFEGETIESKISFVTKEKKKANSPVETSYHTIENLPKEFYQKIDRDSFIEIIEKGGKFYLSIEKSWDFNKIVK